ncbi:MAG: bifunctional heptose 7-phosphate kinase/heptose 1-phosphate adenyltransferase [Planctomycetes bacterium]|nr:bifunctional heptose 7-phosphate kinase/heptose 1-phosphate adenyltransferase [Planctomycetota bacterium]MBL7043536.1 bifunctional heptose 7-phosphate kinase/heptose 1-phosphate adenyltransferase [Pirellulaceae bacterium]
MKPRLPDREALGAVKVLVVGDVILDRYTWGDAGRVSPEAPVLVLRAQDEEVRLGGAASVACLLRYLEARVTLAGVVGGDPSGRTVRRLLEEIDLDTDLLLNDTDRCTTTKERFVGRAAGRHPHQILRVDRESTKPLEKHIEEKLTTAITEQLDGHQAVLVSDYAKGVCTPRLLGSVIGKARERGVPVLVDPARITDYGRYHGASILTPNRAEAEGATGLSIAGPSEAFAAGEELLRTLELDAVFLTLDKDGIAVIAKDQDPEIVPTREREVYDITGAGDMVLAMTGLCHAAGFPFTETAVLANVAAGLEIERLGVTPVTRKEILAEFEKREETGTGSDHDDRCLSPFPDQHPERSNKVVTLEQMADLAASYRRQRRRLVFTNGCFDLLHVGHVTFLEQSAELGDVLIVAINSDASVSRLKGPERPIIRECDRAAMLAALSCVDHVLVFEEDTPHRVLERLRPDILVKGGTTKTVVGREVVIRYGGSVRILEGVPDASTTTIVNRIREPSCT